ncbi:MAG: CPBP family intramembrane metalloprotease [Deltaproteobacteria bacterium]|nr:CPBP family intramembrane metalloprotease [Deltaproteobacteria bacterium]
MTVRSTAGEFPTPWRAVCAYGLLGAVLLLIVALPIATFWRGEPLTVETIDTLKLFEGQGVLAAFLLLWFFLRGRPPLRSFLYLPRGHWAARVAEGIGVGVFGWLVTMTAMIVLGIVARTAGTAPHAGFVELMVWLARRPLPLRLSLIGVAMVVEEAFFRGFLQSRVGLAIATLAFALSHVNYGSPIMGGGVLVIGWVLGRAFHRTQDLAVCAVAHGTFDAIQLLLILPLIASRM